jgi:hypothetical protein
MCPSQTSATPEIGLSAGSLIWWKRYPLLSYSLLAYGLTWLLMLGLMIAIQFE